jgi:hypothetical protein
MKMSLNDYTAEQQKIKVVVGTGLALRINKVMGVWYTKESSIWHTGFPINLMLVGLGVVYNSTTCVVIKVVSTLDTLSQLLKLRILGEQHQPIASVGMI